MIDQGAEGTRTDILAADKPQPVDPLLLREMDALPRFGHADPDA
jgi:hypothetical protein